MAVHIIGNPVSPFVRKIFIALLTKSVAFDFDPVTPFFGNEEFSKLSPLRRIPVFIEERDGSPPFVLNDSTVIGEYIDERWPAPALFPQTAEDRARARWIEEYADSRIWQVFGANYFFQRVVGPRVFKQEGDPAIIERAEQHDMPAVMDWIEHMVPTAGFLFGERPMLADYTVHAFFVNAAIAGWKPDVARWPKAVAWLARISAEPVVQQVERWVEVTITSRRDELRGNLEAAGATLWAKSHATETPRPGILPMGS